VWYKEEITSKINEFTSSFIEPDSPSQVDFAIQDSGSIEVYFCPQEDCEGELLNFIDSAQQSLHCAMYEIDLESVQQKLLEKSTQIDVEVVTDDAYLDQFNYSFVKADKSGLMHNKFCVIDGNKFSTGSMNPTDNCAHKNNNNLLLIESKVLAQNYENEFQEMWNGTFKKGAKVKNPTIAMGNTIITSLFCPEDNCAEAVKEELKKAQTSIYFMTFSFTHDGIGNILLLKHLDNITIKGVMEVKQIDKDSEFGRLTKNGVNVRKDGNKYNLHHKVFIVDEKTVITGSFNPTQNGDKKNDENLVIIRDKEIAREFVEEFWRTYNVGTAT
jgi:phosphatidylserine/phosphatidylglycerophosphate/cardiolipin synthase-like enzyme